MQTIQQSLTKTGLPINEAMILLAYVLKKPKTYLLAHPEQQLLQQELHTFIQLVQRRQEKEPVAYITGTKNFYCTDFFVTNDVLIPRNCTEYLVEKALQELHSATVTESFEDIDSGIVCWTKRLLTTMPCSIVEIGTGSGAISISIAKHTTLPITATDCSAAALQIAKKNCAHHAKNSQITFIQEDDCAIIDAQSLPFLLVSNPPYIPNNETIQPDVYCYEPHQALFAGEQGIDVLTTIVQKCRKNPHCVGWIIECKDFQPASLF